MSFSEIEAKKIDKSVGGLCTRLSPKRYRDQLRYTYEVKGHAVTIWEERPVRDNPNEWTKLGIARFRYNRLDKKWKLYWMRRDLKWHAYDPDVSTASSIEPLVKIVEQDKWRAFFG